LLAGEVVRLTEHRDVSRETIRRRLHEKELKPWQKKMWCIPAVSAEFAGAKIRWLFDVRRAREKMAHAYPQRSTAGAHAA
jgi:hypothetical protein